MAPRLTLAAILKQHVLQQGIRGREDVLGEKHAEVKRHMNGALNGRDHYRDSYPEDLDGGIRVLFKSGGRPLLFITLRKRSRIEIRARESVRFARNASKSTAFPDEIPPPPSLFRGFCAGIGLARVVLLNMSRCQSRKNVIPKRTGGRCRNRPKPYCDASELRIALGGSFPGGFQSRTGAN